MPSIRQKITFGYYAFAGIIVTLAAFAYLDLDYLEQRVILDETISEFFDTTLEMRRDEKNYFLYGEEANYLKTLEHARKAGELLAAQRRAFLKYASSERLAGLERELSQFQQLFQQYRLTPASDSTARSALERDIRLIGRNISSEAGKMNREERADLREALTTARQTLIVSVVLLSLFGIAVGQILSRQVVRPLRLLEDSMRPIAEGKFNKLDLPVRDREIVSFTNAFNRMLHEHDLRLQQLIQSDKLAALGTLVSGVAHELNNPLANISSSCQILLEELNEHDVETQRELLTQIEEQTERARSTVLALLDFSRQGKFSREAVRIRKLAVQTVGFLKGHVPPGVQIKIEVPEDLVASVDRRKIQQVILNLVKNAVDAVGETGMITIGAETRDAAERIESEAVYVFGDHVCEHDGDVVVLSVADTGPGIPHELMSRIFDPFFTTRDVGRGSGLGLYIVEEIVQQHKGCIGVISEPGRGTKFLIKLPIISDTFEPPAAEDS